MAEVEMLKCGNIYRDSTQLHEVDVKSDREEVVVRFHNSTFPITLKGEDAKEFMKQIKPAAVPVEKVHGLKELPSTEE